MDAELEAAIGKAGRERVFDEARRLGWGKGVPPKWVWWEIVWSLASTPSLSPPVHSTEQERQ